MFQRSSKVAKDIPADEKLQIIPHQFYSNSSCCFRRSDHSSWTVEHVCTCFCLTDIAADSSFNGQCLMSPWPFAPKVLPCSRLCLLLSPPEMSNNWNWLLVTFFIAAGNPDRADGSDKEQVKTGKVELKGSHLKASLAICGHGTQGAKSR